MHKPLNSVERAQDDKLIFGGKALLLNPGAKGAIFRIKVAAGLKNVVTEASDCAAVG